MKLENDLTTLPSARFPGWLETVACKYQSLRLPGLSRDVVMRETPFYDDRSEAYSRQVSVEASLCGISKDIRGHVRIILLCLINTRLASVRHFAASSGGLVRKSASYRIRSCICMDALWLQLSM